MSKQIFTYKDAVISEDEKHRFALQRSWRRYVGENFDPLSAYRALIYIMLNPSKADSVKPDPTSDSCVRIANNQGCGHVILGNLWTYRSTDWKALRDPELQLNTEESDHYLAQMFATPGAFLNTNYVRARVVFAWGARVQDIPGASERIQQVLKIYRSSPLGVLPPLCLGTTQSGNPNHPLFMAEATPLQAWTTEEKALSNAR